MVASIDARTGQVVTEVAAPSTRDDVGGIVAAARSAAPLLDQLGRAGRATMLESMADALESRRSMIVEVADRETALGTARLDGELTRTCFQLRFFADVLRDGAYLEATVDHAEPTPMGPRPDLRRMLHPVGPVAVFGASNFPLAFSVPGGDTASALAAGCPVVSKVHDAHPKTAVLCNEGLVAGAEAAGAPAGTVGLVFGEEAGRWLVTHESIRAVGFTGSVAGGRALAELAAGRPSPIPFYGELGALNAFIVTPAAATARAVEIADGLAASFSLGVGQFCTKPGLALVPSGDAGDALVARLAAAVTASTSATMLTDRIASAFVVGVERLQAAGAGVVTHGSIADGAKGQVPIVLAAKPGALTGALLEECFGPVIVVARYGSLDELRAVVANLSPALTATLHGEATEVARLAPVLDELAGRAGRLIWNGYPTGVAVTWAMHHGGPYPATTDPLHTSVGAAAIRRFLRPVAYQDLPEPLLPPELVDEPGAEHLVPRRVDGRLVLPGA